MSGLDSRNFHHRFLDSFSFTGIQLPKRPRTHSISQISTVRRYVSWCFRRNLSDSLFVHVDDVLKARLKTVGVSEYKFEMETSIGRETGTEWRIVDVGGSRSQVCRLFPSLVLQSSLPLKFRVDSGVLLFFALSDVSTLS